ncbi:MAG: SUMF1/EgtB/PvdO family nonheme iron enzyme [Akkermansiaceae bacterium]|nr:SUMF1/EgtB/PvdO family nonheme iron enzyme [Akkermansiaceae bacterium]
MFKKSILITTALLAAWPLSAAKLDFARDVKPILEFNCVSCHQESKAKGGLRLDTQAEMLKGAGKKKKHPVVIPGKPLESSLYSTSVLAADDADVMPPTDHMHVLSIEETTVLKNWITQGAHWTKGVKLNAQKHQLPEKVDFVKHIQPVLEYACISCHGPTKQKADLRLDTKEWAFTNNEDVESSITPGNPLKSTLYTLILLTEENDEDDMMMPPSKNRKKGQFVTYKESALIRKWIEQGAEYPAEVKLLPKKRPSKVVAGVDISPSELYTKLGFEKLAGNLQETKNYTNTIPGTDATYDMLAIPGGTYVRGGSEKNEQPKQEVSIDPFWMQKYEMTWKQYEIWQFNLDIVRRDKDRYKSNEADVLADIVSRPTGPYMDMSFSMGKENRPVICMTQLAAKCYCMWLSAKTGHFYRLATEAEWEYACRAGTKTKYSFGDDESKLGDYAWYFENSDEKYQEVGKKKPNPWGLHDMHGNVSEWVLDSFDKDFYQQGSLENPVSSAVAAGTDNPPLEAAWPTKIYDRVARGGGWDDDPADLRSAKRLLSYPGWKDQDPQAPKSVWYHTDAHWVGFRIVRSARIPLLKDLHKYWPTDEEIKSIPKR